MKTRPTVDYERGLKRCSFCGEWLPFEKFSPSPHKNGGCGLKSYCKPCDKVRYPYKPRENPKLVPKQHIFEIGTRRELRQCTRCSEWVCLDEFFMHGRSRSNLCKPCERDNARARAKRDVRQHAAAAKAWAMANPEKIKARKPLYQQKYARGHLGQLADNQHKRRARLADAAIVETIDRTAIVRRDRSTCYICGIKLRKPQITLDHVIPLARGGIHTAANLRVACGPCNYGKGDRLLCEYTDYLLRVGRSAPPSVQMSLL